MNVHCTFTAELGGERVQKIGQRLAKLWARVSSCFFFTNGVYSGLVCRLWDAPDINLYTLSTSHRRSYAFVVPWPSMPLTSARANLHYADLLATSSWLELASKARISQSCDIARLICDEKLRKRCEFSLTFATTLTDFLNCDWFATNLWIYSSKFANQSQSSR